MRINKCQSIFISINQILSESIRINHPPTDSIRIDQNYSESFIFDKIGVKGKFHLIGSQVALDKQ